MPSIVYAWSTKNEINCKKVLCAYFVYDAVAHFSPHNIWFYCIVTKLFVDENDEPRAWRLPSYNKAEQAPFLVHLQPWATYIIPHQTRHCKLLQDCKKFNISEN